MAFGVGGPALALAGQAGGAVVVPAAVLLEDEPCETATERMLLSAFEMLFGVGALISWLGEIGMNTLVEAPIYSAAAAVAMACMAMQLPAADKTLRAEAANMLDFPLPSTRSHRVLGRPTATATGVAAARAAAPAAAFELASAVQDTDLTFFQQRLATGGAAEAWEHVTTQASEGLQYSAWRQEAPIGRGLSAWRAAAVYEGVSAETLAAFQLDSDSRAQWDKGVATFKRLAGDDEAGAELQFWRCHFPGPFAARDYVCVRRVWTEPAAEEGGHPTLFVVSKSVSQRLPAEIQSAIPGGRSHRVAAYYSGMRVRQVPGGSELATLYYEDAGIAPALVDRAVRRSLWAFMQRQDAALRAWSQANGGGVETRGVLAAAAAAAAPPAGVIPPPGSRGRRRARLRAALGGVQRAVTGVLAAAGRRVHHAVVRGQPMPVGGQMHRVAFDPVAVAVAPLRNRLLLAAATRRRVGAVGHAGPAPARFGPNPARLQPLRIGARPLDGGGWRNRVLVIAAAVALKALRKGARAVNGGIGMVQAGPNGR